MYLVKSRLKIRSNGFTPMFTHDFAPSWRFMARKSLKKSGGRPMRLGSVAAVAALVAVRGEVDIVNGDKSGSWHSAHGQDRTVAELLGWPERQPRGAKTKPQKRVNTLLCILARTAAHAGLYRPIHIEINTLINSETADSHSAFGSSEAAVQLDTARLPARHIVLDEVARSRSAVCLHHL